jgi:hypothetical protein
MILQPQIMANSPTTQKFLISCVYNCFSMATWNAQIIILLCVKTFSWAFHLFLI